MKKTTIAVLLAACSCYIMITSYSGGPGSNGWDCTGAETGLGNPTGCTGSGCHSTSATTGIGVTIELDSVGVPTTHYVGGMTYTVKISGINNTSSNLPRFGLQLGSIVGSSAVTTPTNAGTWTSPYPATTHHAAPQSGNFVVSVVENTNAIAATTGTGGNGTTYVKIFNWTAPAAGTGTISFWGAINAVNNNGNADSGDKWDVNHIVVNEWPSASGIAEAASNSFDMNLYPNPASNNVMISWNNADPGFSKGEIRIMDISGKTVNVIPVSDLSTTTSVDCSALANGIYFFSLVTNDKVVVTRKVIVAK